MANWFSKSALYAVGASFLFSFSDYVQSRLFEGSESILASLWEQTVHSEDRTLFLTGMRYLIATDQMNNTESSKLSEGYKYAIMSLKKAADSGYSEAELKYGELLCYGREPYINRNVPVALVYLSRAFEKGEEKAGVIARNCNLN